MPATTRFPDDVPVLADQSAGARLRALTLDDLPGVIEQCQDPEMRHYTPVPKPYGRTEARQFLEAVAAGWRYGTSRSWVVEAQRDGREQFCGTISLGVDGAVGDVGFGLHPAARGRGLTVAALRLVCEHAFSDTDLQTLRWRARVGNWASRRVAAAVGFRFDGTVRRLLEHRGVLVDGWIATLEDDDERRDLRWPVPPVLAGERVRLRPFTDDDADRIAQACSDPRSRHWLVSLPHPYGREQALAYVAETHESAAQGHAWTWCVADSDDRCVGAISLDGSGSYHRRREIGYWAHPDARGQGLITEAVEVLTAYARTRSDAVTILCAAGNTASRHVAQACGYREVGRLPASEPLGDDTVDDLVTYALV